MTKYLAVSTTSATGGLGKGKSPVVVLTRVYVTTAVVLSSCVSRFEILIRLSNDSRTRTGAEIAQLLVHGTDRKMDGWTYCDTGSGGRGYGKKKGTGA